MFSNPKNASIFKISLYSSALKYVSHSTVRGVGEDFS